MPIVECRSRSLPYQVVHRAGNDGNAKRYFQSTVGTRSIVSESYPLICESCPNRIRIVSVDEPNRLRYLPEPMIVNCRLLLVLLIIGLPACNNPGDEIPSTAQQREQLGPKTRSYLSGAQMALESGSMRQALVMSDSAVSQAPLLADAHFIRARVLATVKRYDEAEKAYERALELDADYLIAAFNLGNLAHQQGRYEHAIAHYRRALRLEDEVAEPLPDDLDAAGRLTALTQIGKTYLELDRLDDARAAFERAKAINPNSAFLNDALRAYHERTGNRVEALEAARAADRFGAEGMPYRLQLTRLLFGNEKFEEVVQVLEPYVETYTYDAEAHEMYGRALAKLGRGGDGERFLALAGELSRKQHIIDSLAASIEIEPQNMNTWLELGEAYIEAGRYNEAVGAFDYLIQFWPDVADAWYLLGVAHTHRQDSTMARFALRSGLQLQPNHEEAQALLRELSM